MHATEDYLPVWLELRVDESSWLFEFPAGEQRAVVVGSHATSDVQVTRDGVASAHFHFEREGDGIVVVPGYRAALIVDHVPAPEPLTLAKRGRVEFCGTVLVAIVHDVPPLHMLLDARNGTDRMMRHPDYFEALPGDWDTTALAIAAVVVPETTDAKPTSEAAEDELDTMTTSAWRAVQDLVPLGPQGTVIMKRPDAAAVPIDPPDERKPASLPPIAPTERMRLERWTAAAASPESSPTRVEVPRPQGRGGHAAPPRSSSRPSFANPIEAAATPSLAPTERVVVPPKDRASALAQLGIAASRHPWRTAAAALPVCAVIALALVGAARLAGRPRTAFASEPALLVQARQAASKPAPTMSSEPRSRIAPVTTLPASASAPIVVASSSPSPPAVVTIAPAQSASVAPVQAAAPGAAQRRPRPSKRVFLAK